MISLATSGMKLSGIKNILLSVLKERNPVYSSEDSTEHSENAEEEEFRRYIPRRSLKDEEYLIKVVLYVTRRVPLAL